MEYLETIEAKRRIVVKIRTVRQMIFIHQENVLQGSLHMEGGIPVTTKGETHDHGFGIKSIVATATRYNGDVTINTENCRFSVDIMFQKPCKEK